MEREEENKLECADTMKVIYRIMKVYMQLAACADTRVMSLSGEAISM